MKVVCACCERDSKPSYFGEREPSENSVTTHRICPRHTEQILEGLPSLSFPDAEMLIVVHSNNPGLYEHLVPRFAEIPGVKVILDHRRADYQVDERVRKDRRIRRGTVSALGYTVVRFKRKEAAATAVLQETMRIAGD
jgi:hypothetical protein